MQVFVIHGGDSFASYEEFLSYLKTKEIDLSRLQRNDWKVNLSQTLGCEVIFPSMPNKQNAKYLEWKIWFERFIPFIQDGVILIGHSLGGMFLAKYLSEEKFPKKITATFLVAAPYNITEVGGIYEFNPPQSLDMLAAQGGQIHLYQSKDDPVVSFSEVEKYQKVLPKAQAHVFEDRGHFNQEEFPELVDEIKKLI